MSLFVPQSNTSVRLCRSCWAVSSNQARLRGVVVKKILNDKDIMRAIEYVQGIVMPQEVHLSTLCTVHAVITASIGSNI